MGTVVDEKMSLRFTMPLICDVCHAVQDGMLLACQTDCIDYQALKTIDDRASPGFVLNSTFSSK